MPRFFRIVAVDFDGTIAEHDRVHPAALRAIGELRRQRRKVLLCTGRRLEGLRAVFPHVDRHFDAIIAENGGILVMASEVISSAAPLPPELGRALAEAGVPFERGRVLLATHVQYADAVAHAVERLGLEAQLVYNRGALMVLPSGVSKGAGLLHALGLLEISRHSAIGIGDAENDHSLLQSCEIGVAVGNAVPGLRGRADLCLEEGDGAGVAAFLRGPVLHGAVQLHPARWMIELGRGADGTPARVPGSGVNMLIAGASGSGKSRLAGLVVERLVALDYACCVLDAEGDHAGLDALPGIIAVGGREPLPTAQRIAAMVRNRFSSVVADLSLLDGPAKRVFAADVLRELHALRCERGFPHWIVIEEADQLVPDDGLPAEECEGPIGYCLVTHRPSVLPMTLLAGLDAVVALPGAERYARMPFPVAETDEATEEPFVLQTGQALLATKDGIATFEIGARVVPHVRHQHKYLYAQVQAERRFFFGHRDGGRRSASNLAEFRDEVQRAAPEVLREHLDAGDFSRWMREVIADDELGARLRGIERWFHNDPEADIEAARTATIAAIRDRYASTTRMES